MKLIISSAVLLLIGRSADVCRVDAFSPSLAASRTSSSTVINSVGASTLERETHLSMSSDQIRDLAAGTVVTKRYLHRFSPSQSAIKAPYAIEERQNFSVGSDKSLVPLSEKSLIFRENDAAVTADGFIAIGSPLFTVDGLKLESTGLSRFDWGSAYALALYSMKYPEIISGKGLGVASGEGIAGILSVIGAGLSSGATIGQTGTPSPNALSSIVMTDSSEELLNVCIDNLGVTSFPVSKIGLGLLDWNKRLQPDMKDDFDFILGCNCAKESSAVAKVVAFALKTSPENGSGSFVHIGSGGSNGVVALNNDLQRKHRLNTAVKELVLERIELEPFVNGNEEVTLSIDYENVESGKFSVLVAFHDEAHVEKLFEKDKSAILRAAYSEWCKIFHKKESDARFPTFASNFILMKNLADQRGEPIKLNQWYDCTQEEYQAAVGSTMRPVSKTVSQEAAVALEAEGKARKASLEAMAESAVSKYAEGEAEKLVVGERTRFFLMEEEANISAEHAIALEEEKGTEFFLMEEDTEVETMSTEKERLDRRANEILKEKEAEEIAILAIDGQRDLIEAQAEKAVEVTCESAAEERTEANTVVER